MALLFSRTEKSEDDLARNNRLSRQLKGTLIVALGTLAFALLDTFGATLYASLAQNRFDVVRTFGAWQSALSASGLGALAAFGRKLATFLAERAAGKRLSCPAAAAACRGKRSPGRGTYVHARLSCFERAAARRAFSRTLRRNVRIPENIVSELEAR